VAGPARAGRPRLHRARVLRRERVPAVTTGERLRDRVRADLRAGAAAARQADRGVRGLAGGHRPERPGDLRRVSGLRPGDSLWDRRRPGRTLLHRSVQGPGRPVPDRAGGERAAGALRGHGRLHGRLHLRLPFHGRQLHRPLGRAGGADLGVELRRRRGQPRAEPQAHLHGRGRLRRAAGGRRFERPDVDAEARVHPGRQRERDRPARRLLRRAGLRSLHLLPHRPGDPLLVGPGFARSTDRAERVQRPLDGAGGGGLFRGVHVPHDHGRWRAAVGGQRAPDRPLGRPGPDGAPRDGPAAGGGTLRHPPGVLREPRRGRGAARLVQPQPAAADDPGLPPVPAVPRRFGRGRLGRGAAAVSLLHPRGESAARERNVPPAVSRSRPAAPDAL